MTPVGGLPTFFVIGAARCGTTSMHYYLAQHPAIGMSAIKEPNHFLFRQTPAGPVPLIGDDRRVLAKSVPDRARYLALFDADAPARGDVSPLYLYTRETPGLLAEAAPQARLVAVLREPAARAWSHFVYLNGDLGDRMAVAFAAAVETELPLAYSPYKGGDHFLRLGRYGEQVARYLDHFPAEHLLLLRYDELVSSPATALTAVCRLIGVDETFGFDTSVRYNPGSEPRSAIGLLDRAVRPAIPYLKRLLPAGAAGRLARRRHQLRARAAAGATGPAPDATTMATLADYYADDLARLESLTGLRLEPQ